MIVIGVDGSLTCTGVAVIDTDGVPGTERILHTGTVRSKPGRGTDLERYHSIAESVVSVAKQHGATLAGVEQPYMGLNAKTAFALRSLDTIIEAALAQAGLTVVGVNVSQRSSALGVAGKTKRKPLKDLVVQAVSTRYGLNVTHDQADAIGVGLAAVKLYRRGERPEQLRMKLPGGRARRKNVKQPESA